MNFLTLVISVDTEQFIIFFIFSESVLNLLVLIMYPKNLIFLYSNLHFFNLITRFAFHSFIKTFFKCVKYSSKISKHTNMSSKYMRTPNISHTTHK